MREPPNKLLRILVPLIFVAAGVGMLFVVLKNSKPAPPTPAPATPAATSAAPQGATAGQGTPGDAAATPASGAVEAPAPTDNAVKPVTPAPPGGYKVRKHPTPAAGYAPLGSAVPRGDGGTYELELRFSEFGAGLDRLTLANHLEEVLRPAQHVVQSSHPLLNDSSGRLRLTAFSARGIEINGVEVGLGIDPTAPQSTLWAELSPGVFEATVTTDDDQPVLKITRAFTLAPGSYEFQVRQTLTNLSAQPLTATLHQIGPIDQPQGIIRYGGDPRQIRFGYIDDPKSDPTLTVRSEDSAAGMLTRSDALGRAGPNGAFAPRTIWPTPLTQRKGFTLVWAATTSRYFVVAAHNPPLVKPAAGGGTPPAASLTELTFSPARIDRVAIPTERPVGAHGAGPFAAVGLDLVSTPMTLAPQGSADVSIAAFAGPSSRRSINSQPAASRLGVAEVVIYTFGGPCGFCTFQTLTQGLRWFLTFLHDRVVFDWALAIVVLVLCVRTMLHPVTRWSQVNMLRFGKGMQKLAPKQKAIQEKYKDDPLKMREEVSRLMREEQLGCASGVIGFVPALLQTPIWIALSATLYFVFELRHQHAFFGIFQSLGSGRWSFFADLAEPDHFLRFGREFYIPLLSGIMGPIDGLNIMPILMGVVFYIQQKYMSPPPTTAMSPEQEQQMKIMRVMTVVLFPFFMYNAPSGLALYFFINSTLAIIESKHIRARAERLGLDQPRPKVSTGMPGRRGKKGDAPPKEGLLARLQRMAEEKQKMMDEAKRLQAKREKGKK